MVMKFLLLARIYGNQFFSICAVKNNANDDDGGGDIQRSRAHGTFIVATQKK